MTLRFSALGFGTSAQSPRAPKSKKEPLPVEIQLGSNAVKLTPEGWKLGKLSRSFQGSRRLQAVGTRSARAPARSRGLPERSKAVGRGGKHGQLSKPTPDRHARCGTRGRGNVQDQTRTGERSARGALTKSRASLHKNPCGRARSRSVRSA
ncbi:unnamed protein product, partial [Pylaiella littoralis]